MHNKTTIELRESGAAFRIAMSHHEFLVFINMLQSSDDSKILRLSIPDPYPYRVSEETLVRARDVLEGKAQEGVIAPTITLNIGLIGFGLLFDN